MPDDNDECVLRVSSDDGSPISITHKGEKICFTCNAHDASDDHPKGPLGSYLRLLVTDAIERSDAPVVHVTARTHLLDLDDLHPAMEQASRSGQRIHLTLTRDE